MNSTEGYPPGDTRSQCSRFCCGLCRVNLASLHFSLNVSIFMVIRVIAIRLLVIICARVHGRAIIPPSTRELYNASPKENIIIKQMYRTMGWWLRLPLPFSFFFRRLRVQTLLSTRIVGINVVFELESAIIKQIYVFDGLHSKLLYNSIFGGHF